MYNNMNDSPEDSVLQRFASSQKANALLSLFLTDKNITGRATAMCGICQILGYKEGTKEIMQFLEGTHEILPVPLQTLERFWHKHVQSFSNKNLKIYGKNPISMVEADKILAKVDVRLYFINSQIALGEYNNE